MLVNINPEQAIQYLTSVLNTMQGAIVSIALPSYRIILMSKSFEMIFGYSLEDFLSDRELFKRVIHPDDLESTLAMRDKCLRDGYAEHEHRIILPNGQIRWLHRRAWLTYDENGQAIQINDTAQDITTRKLAEETLRLNEEKYRSLINSSDATISMVDANGVYLYLNSLAALPFGVSPEALVGKAIHDLFPKDQADQILADVQRVVRDNNGFILEPQVTINNKTCWFRTSMQPVRDGEGKAYAVLIHASEITEKKLVEQEILVQNEILHQSRDLISLSDLDGYITFLNQGGAKMIGAKNPDALLGKHISLFYDSEEIQQIFDKYIPYAFKNGYWQGESRLKSLDGRVMDIDQTIFPIRNPDGVITRMATIITDITSRKLAEKTLQEAHILLEERVEQRTLELRQRQTEASEMQFYLTVLHELTLGLAQCDTLDDFYRLAVKQGLDLFRFERIGLLLYDNGDAIGTYGTDVHGNIVSESHLRITKDDLPSLFVQSMNPHQRALFADEVVTTLPDGHVVLFPKIISALWDKGNVVGWLATDNFISKKPFTKTQRDIFPLYALSVESLLGRKRAEIALRQSEERYRFLAENIQDVIAKVTLDGIFTFVTPSCYELSGHTPSELIGNHVSSFNHPDDIELSANAIIKAIKENKNFFTVQQRIRHKDGHYIWVEITNTIVFDTNGIPQEMIGIVHDISQRKQAEEALRKSIEHEKELGNLKSRFVSMASHEFRTPLASILATTETLTMYRDKMDDDKINARLDKIRQQVMHMKEIMDDVLQLARVQAGRMEFNPSEGNLDVLFREIIEEFDIQEAYHGRIIYTHSIQPIITWYDPRLMRQIISNFVSNALKYSSLQPIYITVQQLDEVVKISFQDSGIGIPPEDIKYLFEPFHRATNVGTISGTGLGLSISKQAVELHQGQILVESQVGIGTTFTVLIPFKTNSEVQYGENSGG